MHSAATDGIGMIYLGMSPWDGMWKNRHHLMSRFARKMPVVYVEPWQGLRKVRRALLSGRRVRELNWQISSERSKNLHVFESPAQLAVSGSGMLRALTRNRWYSGIQKVARDAGIRRPILWISRPEMASAVGRFGESLSIYHVVDEYGGYTKQDEETREKLWREEEGLLDAVDVSIVVSKALLQSKSGPGRDVFLVENAVDIGAYDARRDHPDTPADLAAIPRPRLGYGGLIGKRLDLALLLNLARSRPEWSIVLFGKTDRRDCTVELDALAKQENVYFLGEKSYEQVPDYVLGLDIGLLPYRINMETRNISPLKMYEYLAAGLPVVSTPIPAVESCKTVVDIHECESGFEEACESRLLSNDKGAVESRVTFARRNSWESRVGEIWDIISARLQPDMLVDTRE
jgi:glycosyltransferase involved in cell wall biosynthesis